jgi:hypothetical protein
LQSLKKNPTKKELESFTGEKKKITSAFESLKGKDYPVKD